MLTFHQGDIPLAGELIASLVGVPAELDGAERV